MNADTVLKEIEAKIGKETLPIVGPVRGQVLTMLVTKMKPKKILEIGTLTGYSAILLAKHLPVGSKITTIEKNPLAAAQARENFKKAGVEQSIDLKVGNALSLIPTLEGPFEIVFIDAEKTEYLDYLKMAEEKMTPQGVVAADNVKIFEAQLQDYLEYVRNSGKYESQTYDFEHDAIEVSTRKI